MHEGKPDIDSAIAPVPATTTDPGLQAPLPLGEPSLRLRKSLFVLWALAFVPLFAALRTVLVASPAWRSLIGTAVFSAPAVAGLWFLGRERQRTLHVWRIVLVVWALLLLPLLLSVADGLAAEGWPRGRFNKAIARMVISILILTVPAFLAGLCALIRTYRLTSVLSLVTGLAYLVNGVLLIRETAPAKGLRLRFQSVLDLILLGAQMGSYLSVGGIMIFRAARARARTY